VGRLAARRPDSSRTAALQRRSLSAVTATEVALTAAFGASLLTGLASLGVVWFQQRRQGKATDQEWRRSEERPIVARMLTLSADALAEWQQSAQARQEWLDSKHADPTLVHEDTEGRDKAAPMGTLAVKRRAVLARWLACGCRAGLTAMRLFPGSRRLSGCRVVRGPAGAPGAASRRGRTSWTPASAAGSSEARKRFLAGLGIVGVPRVARLAEWSHMHPFGTCRVGRVP